MPNGTSEADPVAMGRRRADEILARRASILARRAARIEAHPDKLQLNVEVMGAAGPVGAGSAQTIGFLVAAGDSWFDYPFYDVLKLLEDEHGYNVESAAHRGDPIESMAYQGGQLDKLARCFEKVLARGATPKAVLMSGGGDDIAGAEFGMLLNNATSAIHGWNNEIVDGVLNQRIAVAYRYMFGAITQMCVQKVGRSLPILVHGYDYPVPDGRGFLGGWPFPGPWLQPGFHEKLFSDLPTNVTLMHDVLDRFNAMLSGLVREPAFSNVKYVDVRNTLSTVLAGNAYQQWWGNELHPTEQGFSAVTDKFAQVLSTV